MMMRAREYARRQLSDRQTAANGRGILSRTVSYFKDVTVDSRGTTRVCELISFMSALMQKTNTSYLYTIIANDRLAFRPSRTNVGR